MKKLLPLAAIGLLALAVFQFLQQRDRTASDITLFCAAGLKHAIDPIAKQFEVDTGIQVSLQYGPSATLLTQLQVAKTGDLYLAADEQTMEDAVKLNLVDEVIPVATQYPVLAVRQGNPHNIRRIEDLLKDGVKVALPNPNTASIGRVTQGVLGDETWAQLEKQASVIKASVTEIAADLAIGAVDVALLWNSTVAQFKGLEMVVIPSLQAEPEPTSIALLKFAQSTPAAFKFVRYLTAPDKGNPVLTEHQLTPVPGDAWNPKPDLLLYSGGVNRPAIEKLVQAFANREGISVTTVFNGCGILCATIKALNNPESNQMPDAYYACDICFVPPVAEHFPEAVLLTETAIVIAKPKSGTHRITTLADLAQPGLKVGICNAEQSTLGFMTKAMLGSTNLLNGVMKNVVVQVPTADFLVNQMRAGALDAAIVYEVNVRQVAEHFDVIPLPPEMAKAIQPFAVRAASPNYHLGQRLLSFLRNNPDAFTEAGFIWRGEETAIPSDQLEIPDYLKGAGN